MDLTMLAAELAQLQDAMAAQATSDAELVSVATIAQAREAAETGDRPATLGHLAKAGRWTLGVAEKIGVGLAVAAIKAHVG